MNPLISIVIPVYNVEKYLDTMITSVLNQTYDNFEVIALNDGSTDNSLEILKKYAESDNRIRVIDKENTGVSDTRNKGIELSKGEYLSLVDSDDMLSPFYLEKLVKTAIETKADMVVCNYNMFRSELYDYNNKNLKYNIIDRDELLQKGLMTSACTKLFRTKIIKAQNVGFKYGMTFGEDLFFCWKAFELANKVYYIDEPLYGYRMTGEGATNRFHPGLYESYKASFEDLKNFCKSNNCLTDANNWAMDLFFTKRLTSYLFMTARGKDSFLNKKSYITKIVNDDIIKNVLNNHFNELVLDETKKNIKLYQNARKQKVFQLMKFGYIMEIRIKISTLKSKILGCKK